MAGNDDDYMPDGDAVGIVAKPCKVDECTSQLDGEKLFYKRARCCSHHARQLQVMVEGQERRFCQQCCGFHRLSAFDGTRRSCRVRLEAHNERQRKRWSDTGGSRRRPQMGATNDLFDGCPPQQPTAQPPLKPQPPHNASHAAAPSPASLAQAAVAALFGQPPSALPLPPPVIMPGQSLAGGQQCSPALFPWPANPAAASSVPLPQVPASGGAPTAGEEGQQQGQQHAAGLHRILRSNSAEVRIRGLGPNGNDGAHTWSAPGMQDHSHQQAAASAVFVANRSYSLGSTLPPAASGANLLRGSNSEVDRLLGRSEGVLETAEWGQSGSSLATAQRSTSIESAGTSAVNCSVGGIGSGLRMRSWSATALELDSCWKVSDNGMADLEVAELGLENETEALAFAEQAPEPLVRAQQLMGLHLPAHRRPQFSYRASGGTQERRSLDACFARRSDPYMGSQHLATVLPGEPQQRRCSLDAQVSKMNKYRILTGGAAKRTAKEDLPRKQLPAAFMWLGDGWDTNETTPPT